MDEFVAPVGAGAYAAEMKTLPPSHPRPTLWRVLVRDLEAAEKTAGGIYLPEAAKDAQGVVGMMGVVVEVGPLAYSREDMRGVEACKPGDCVMFGSYAGSRFAFAGAKHRILNDDEIIAVVPDASLVKRN